MNRKKGKTTKTVAVSINPATGEKLKEFPVNSIPELSDAIKKASIAQQGWAAVPVKKRVRYMMKIRRYLVDHIEEFAKIISKDNGKSVTDALITDLLNSAMAVTYYSKMAPKFLKERKLSAGNFLLINKRSRVVRVPFGVVGIISPWNFPFGIPFHEVIMALLAGNAVILKTASETPWVGQILKDGIEAADLPDHVFNYINMPGSIAGDAFLEGGIDKLFFTGSVPVGKYLMRKAAETLTPVSLELSGNDPMIVCEDADLERAASGAVWAGFQNAGQSCAGVERIYVHRGVYHDFLEILKGKIESLRIGEGTDYNTDIGPLTVYRQVETVRKHVSEALRMGAVVFAEKKPPADLKGFFLPCTVLTGVNHEMMVMKEETFGPVVGVMLFETYDEAVALANDSDLGLTASVWSRDRKKAMEIGRRIRAGAITVNDHLMSHGLPETPWGGFKQSSIGRTHGRLGFDEMTQPQVIVNDILPFVKKNFWWHPFSKKIFDAAAGAAYFLYGRNILVRIKGLISLLKVFPRTFFRGS